MRRVARVARSGDDSELAAMAGATLTVADMAVSEVGAVAPPSADGGRLVTDVRWYTALDLEQEPLEARV